MTIEDGSMPSRRAQLQEAGCLVERIDSAGRVDPRGVVCRVLPVVKAKWPKGEKGNHGEKREG